MFLVQCPKCGNKMNYQPIRPQTGLANKKKSCVYCGYGIPVKGHILKKL